MTAQALRYMFILALILIVVVYFAGVSTDAAVFGDVLNKLGMTFTGRNAQGKFAAYPAAS